MPLLELLTQKKMVSGASGNVATEDVVYMLQGMDIDCGVDLHALIDVGKFICDFLNKVLST